MLKRNKILFFICLFFLISYSALSIIHHQHFLSGGFDLGIYDQAVWQYSQFSYPFSTIKMRMILGDHLTLTLPFLAPLYWVWDSVIMLLLFQAAWISISGVAVFKYLLLRKFSNIQANLLTFIYLLFYGMQYISYFDFHPVVIGIGLLAWIVYLWEAKRWKLFAIFTILLLLTQENMGIALFGLSIIWFFQGKRQKPAIFMGIIGILSSLAAFQAIKLFSDVGLEYTPVLPREITGYITQFFDSPEKREVWLYSLSWYSLLPLFSLGSMLAVLSDLSQYFLTGQGFSRMWSPFMHHRAILSIFFLLGAVDTLIFLRSKKINITYVVMAMFFVAVFLQWQFHFALNKLTKNEFVTKESWMGDNEEVLAKVPKKASIAAQQSLVPHLSHRQEIYLIYPRKRGIGDRAICPQKECWWLEFSGKPEYLVVDAHDNAWLTMTLADIKDFRQAIETMEKAKAIELVYRKNEARLYKINYLTENL